MKYNFDEVIDRHNTDCVKIELCDLIFGTSDVQQMWVADMDFRTPDCIFDAIFERSKHPILGYTVVPSKYLTTVKNWQFQQHQWNIKEKWMGFVAGIVPGLSFAVQVFTELEDEIIIQPPVYHPFIHVVENNNRKLVYNPLKAVDNKFEMDFEDLERKITDRTKMLILCNPHNPGGKVWDEATLIKLANICAKNNIIVISDEIHADMVLEGYKHTPFAKVSEKAADISITFTAPTKTFNMPGLQSSTYTIPNDSLRRRFKDFLIKNEMIGGNIFAYVATIAAYEKGNEWRLEMLRYVKDNIQFVTEYLKNNIPQIKPMQPEASFLIWLDFRDLGISDEALPEFVVKNAKLALNDGRTFGPGGEGHLRLNVACSRSRLEIALDKLKNAVENI